MSPIVTKIIFMEEARELPITTQSDSSLTKIAYYILLGLSFVALIAFIPGVRLDNTVIVSLLTVIGAGLVSIIYAIFVVKEGRIEFIKHPFFYALFGTNVIFLVSALLSDNIHNSLIGFGGQSSTFGFFFVASLVLFFTSLLFNTKDRIFSAYALYFLAFGLIALYHIVRFVFGPSVLSFGAFPLVSSSVLGSFNNVAIFFGAGALMSLLISETLDLSKRVKYLVRGMLLVSLFFLAVVNFIPAWVVIGIFSLALFIYRHITDRVQPTFGQLEQHTVVPYTKKRFKHIFSLGTCVIALIFVLFGNRLYPPLATMVGVSVVDVRPSWTATMQITQSTLGTDFLFGSGPNTFARQWMQYKPDAVNETIFFATDFNTGVGFIPTLIATTGVLGFIAICAMLVTLLYAGFRVFSQDVTDVFLRYLLISSFAISVYLWVMLFVYTPSASMLLFSFFFLGLFFATAKQADLISVSQISFTRHPRTSFITIILVVFLVIVSTSFAYGFAKSALSRIYFAQSVRNANRAAPIDEIERPLLKALSIEPHDVYYRALVDAGLFRMSVLARTPQGAADPVELQGEFQAALTATISAAEEAIRIDRMDYLNWLKLAEVYAFVAVPPFSLDGAYENAIESFAEAEKLNATNPAIQLRRARLNFGVNRIDVAREDIRLSLAKKTNYFEAHFLLSQIEALTGNLPRAVESAERSAILAPNDAGVFFQLGLLHYNANNYQNAIDAFGRAVSLVPNYSNAKYFLGLSLERVGRREEAIVLFEQIEALNPDNMEVKFILANLRAGKPPFVEAPDSIEDEPEKAESLPLDE